MYHNKIFKPVSNTENGETTSDTVFHYHQEGNIVTSSYKGGGIVYGHLIALVGDDGSLDMRYHQVNTAGNLMTGKCQSIPEIMENGKIRLHETWQWTTGDMSHGQSIIEEV